MASSINASLTAGLVQTADTSGIINLQSGGTTVATISSTGVAVTGTLSASGAVTGITDLTTTGNTILGNASTDTLNVGNGDLVKDASGNVGINTPTPDTLLHITKNSATAPTVIKLQNGQSGGDGTGSKISFTGTRGAPNAVVEYGYITGAMYDWTGTPYMKIAISGVVSMPNYGAGAATFSAAGVISSVSDETWKTKDGVPLNPDAMLQKLEPGYWYYNEEKAPIFGSDRQLGFYAQNVNYAIGVEAAPIPEEGKPWGYYDRSVLAVTVMSLQKALATIESLTARLDEQQAQISVLQGAK